jgi:hypothetical protein
MTIRRTPVITSQPISPLTLTSINAAAISAIAKHGPHAPINPTMSDPERLAILVEEVGEVAHALTHDADSAQLEGELIQVAAVAAMWIESKSADTNPTDVPLIRSAQLAAIKRIFDFLAAAQPTVDGAPWFQPDEVAGAFGADGQLHHLTADDLWTLLSTVGVLPAVAKLTAVRDVVATPSSRPLRSSPRSSRSSKLIPTGPSSSPQAGRTRNLFR